MILPWSKEAKVIKLVKLQQQLYSDLKNMPISSIEEVAILEKENRDNQINKLLIANHAIRNEFKELSLPKLPNAPGIVVPYSAYVGESFVALLTSHLTNYEKILPYSSSCSDEFYYAVHRAHVNLIKAQLSKLSEQLGLPITDDNILRLVTEIKYYKKPEQPVLVGAAYNLPIPELEAIAKHFRSDIYIY